MTRAARRRLFQRAPPPMPRDVDFVISVAGRLAGAKPASRRPYAAARHSCCALMAIGRGGDNATSHDAISMTGADFDITLRRDSTGRAYALHGDSHEWLHSADATPTMAGESEALIYFDAPMLKCPGIVSVVAASTLFWVGITLPAAQSISRRTREEHYRVPGDAAGDKMRPRSKRRRPAQPLLPMLAHDITRKTCCSCISPESTTCQSISLDAATTTIIATMASFETRRPEATLKSTMLGKEVSAIMTDADGLVSQRFF